MPGNPLPTRQSWQFRNTTKSVDFWCVLPSISIEDGNAEDLSTFSATIIDTDASQTFEVEDNIWVKLDGVKVFGGRIKTRGRAYLSEAGPRVFDIEGQDYTSKLDDSVITYRKSRKAESGADRLAWILSFLNFPITTGGVNLPSGDVDPYDADGATVREALDALAEQLRLSFYVDYDADLHIFRTETISAPFALNDRDPDFVTSFPYREWSETDDSVELANAQYVQGEQGVAWVEDSASIAQWGRQERSISDPELRTAAQIANAGARANAEVSQPLIDGQCEVWEPGLRAGMTVLLTNDLHALEEVTRIITKVTIEAVDPHDDDGEAYVKTLVQYSDRRRARPFRKPRHPDRDAEPGDGDSVPAARWCHEILAGRLGLASASRYESIPDEDNFDGPDGPTNKVIQQNSHPHNIPWTAGVCALGLGGWGGMAVREQWFELTVGTLDGVTGLRFEVELDDTEGDVTNVMYGIAHAPPTPYRQRDFDPVGVVPCADGTQTGYVPASLLEPSGTNYLVFAMERDAQYSPGSWVCSNDEAGISDAIGNGLFLSGGTTVDGVDVWETTIEQGGLTDWVGGEGEADGSNRTFGLVDWGKAGTPQVRVGAVVQAWPADYTYDRDAGTITLRTAPPAGSAVAFRYKA